MELIDRKFGGAIPLDIIIDAPADFAEKQQDYTESDDIFAAEDDEFDFLEEEKTISSGYWFNSFIFSKIRDIHQYLDNIPETGKILSLDTTIRTLESLNKGNVIDSFTMNVAYNKISEDLKKILYYPYILSLIHI